MTLQERMNCVECTAKPCCFQCAHVEKHDDPNPVNNSDEVDQMATDRPFNSTPEALESNRNKMGNELKRGELKSQAN